MTAPTPPAKAPVWPGPRLIVPMAVDCLLIGTGDLVGGNWARTQFDYENLAFGLGNGAAPPFTEKTAAEQPGTGAHLMWTLPYALRRGAAPGTTPTATQAPGETQALETLGAAPGADPAGSLDFPLIPDRWLVLRIGHDPAGGSPSLTARLISADTLTPPQGGTIPLNVSQYPLTGHPTAPVGILGAVSDLAAWTGDQSQDPPFLRAVAPGDMTWVAAYDNVRNVVTMHDPLDDTARIYSYSVIGWYARPDDDPLRAIDTASDAAWRQALATATGWSMGKGASAVTSARKAWTAWAGSHGIPDGAPDAALPDQLKTALGRWQAWQKAHGAAGPEPDLPRQTMVNGLLSGVVWNGLGHAYGTGAPGHGAKPPAIAIGSTAAEAIAAWLADTLVTKKQEDPSTIPFIERAIDAFQAGLLNDLEQDPGRTEAQLHATHFDAAGQLDHWTVVRPEVGSQDETKAGGDPSLPLDPRQTDALIALNRRQAELDALTRTLTSQQAELFALSWKDRFLPRGSQGLQSKIDAARQALTPALKATAAQIAAIDGPQGTLAAAEAHLKTELAGEYDIRRVSGRPAYRPSDPVILVAGAGGDPKYAGPSADDADETLICRITGQWVTGIDLTGVMAGAASVDAASLLDGLTLPVADPLPKELPELWLEALFLDPDAAPFLARQSLIAGGDTSPKAADILALAAKIAPIQRAPWLDFKRVGATRQATATAVGLTGRIPAVVGVTFRDGQPWSPVFVDWSITWTPDGDDLQSMLAKWHLGDDDFDWTGGKVTPAAVPQQFRARTIFDPTVAQSIAKRLTGFQDNDDYKNLPRSTRKAFEDMVGLIGAADLYTCAATGLTEQLLTRLIAPNNDAADTALDPLVGNAPVGFVPQPGSATPVHGKLVDQPFYPLRSGHLQLLDLWVVDSWGQILRGKTAPPGAPASSRPVPNVIRAQSLTTPPFMEGKTDVNADYLQLTPRISQETELRLDLLSAHKDGVLSTSSDATSPICGFVVPNNLDVSLAVFDQAGGSDGSILLIEHELGTAAPSATGLRWDAPPGSPAALGAPPDLTNPHLQGLVSGLLDAGLTQGGAALDDLFDRIDSVLWALAPLGQPTKGPGTLLGPPLAVVRAQISAHLPGLAIPNQSWGLTGDTYVDANGGYKPIPVPVMGVTLPARLGDSGLKENGVMGYFVDDDYSTFHAVYGAGGQTGTLRRALRSGAARAGNLAGLLGQPLPAGTTASYVTDSHVIPVPLDGTPVKLTLLVDPRGRIPVISGWQPWIDVGLPAGPVSAALSAMTASFRVGPLLTDPHDIRMPLPAEVRGNWGWVERADITGWSPTTEVKGAAPKARLADTPLHLSEGWLTLSGAFGREET
ncbi:MAG: hypothetical protein AAGE03_05455 [Pseudomonadota bacterium]